MLIEAFDLTLMKVCIMKIISDCCSKDKVYFDSIMFVHFDTHTNQNYKVIDKVSKDASLLEISHFFKKIAKFICSREARQVYRHKGELGHFQFMLSSERFKEFPVKWFTLEFDNGIVINHDIAFCQIYIYKNGHRVYFNSYFNDRITKNRKYVKYLELKNKRNAYKFIANQVLK